jgi:rhamnosyltransferase
MKPLPKAVSVVMRSFNEAWAIGDTLRQLASQHFDGEIELLVIDSGSSDGSIPIIQAAHPAKLIQIPLGTYVPGVVLNQGAREASHDWIVYLNADATPAGPDWLANLLAPCLLSSAFGAGFSRQIPRPDCQAVFAHDYDRCFGPNRVSTSWDHFFSMVSSVTHRSVWEKHPLREDLQYAEDDEWTRRLAANGLEIIYAPESIAMHSHNYTLRQSFRRAAGDARALAAAGSLTHRSIGWPATLAGIAADAARDARWCLSQGNPAGWPFAAATRAAQRLGKRHGALSTLQAASPP